MTVKNDDINFVQSLKEYIIFRLMNFMQEFLVKYAHKYAQKSTKICKNVLKYALNMEKNLFSIKWRHFTLNNFSVNFKSFD